MSRHLIFSILICTAVLLQQGRGLAQESLTRQAVELAKAERFEEADAGIARALNSFESEDPTTWYVHAFIQKSLFVVRDGRRPDSRARSVATQAAMECARRDPEGRLADKRTSLLTFLADTHLEDARDAVRASQPGEAAGAHAHLRAHSDIQLFLDPEWDSEPDAVLLDQMLAEFAFGKAEQLERANAGPWFQWGRSCYERAASRQPDRFRSLFNLAVHTYNQGVRQFKASDDDLDAVDSALKQAAILWNLAAEGLEQAISEDSKRSAGYEALAVVSEALLNQDRVEWCRANLDELGAH